MTFALGQRIDLSKAANDSGFELITYEADGSLALLAGADTALRPTVRIAEGGWEIALGDAAVARTIAEEGRFPVSQNGCFIADGTGALTELLLRAWRLDRALPQAPLRRFEAAVAAPEDLTFRTDVERLVRQRIGQSLFRDALMDYWDGRCAVTGVEQSALLRASHIKPWADCASDAERMDVFNGLLLTADWDAAFDAGLITFDLDGRAITSQRLEINAQVRLDPDRLRIVRPLTDDHRRYLDWHLAHVFQG
ncbi:MAG: HNH endonuclease [Pseudomonadota bacterium]